MICDRYYHSGFVYSAAKHNPSLDLHWARAPEVGLPRPDMVLFLDLEEPEARARGGWGGELYERSDIQRRVRDMFWALSLGKLDKNPHAGGVEAIGEFRQEMEDLIIVDASLAAENVAQEIWTKVEPRIAVVERGEIGRTVRTVL